MTPRLSHSPSSFHTSLRPVLAAVAALTLSSACAHSETAPVPDRAAAAAIDPRAAFAAARARELDVLPLQTVKTADGAVQFQVEAAGAPSLKQEPDLLQIEIPIGTDAPIACFLYGTAVPPATALTKLFTGVLQATHEHAYQDVDVAFVGEVPSLSAVAHYAATRDGKQALGALQVAAFDLDDRTLACVLDDAGHRATFRRITAGLVRTLVTTPRPDFPRPRERTVYIMKIDGKPAGYLKALTSKRDDGALLEHEVSALFGVVRGAPVASDTVSLSIADAKGDVERIVSVEDDGDVVTKTLTVLRTARGKYAVEGTIQGKPVKGDFSSAEPLRSGEALRAEIKAKLLAPSGAESLSVPTYVDDLDPLAATQQVVKRTDKPGVLAYSMGPRSMDVVVDEQGEAKTIAMRFGDADLTLERVVHVPAR